MGCYPVGAELMAPKAVFLAIRVKRLLPQAANILKQEMLAKGGEAAVPSGALRMEAGRVDCIVMGTLAQYTRLVDILKQQPFELSDLANRLQLFTGLAAARPARTWFGTDADVAIGGLVDCDFRPPGVHDHAANAVARAWNLLEERSDFLVVTGSNNSMVPVSYTHLRAHETRHDLVCRLLLEKKKTTKQHTTKKLNHNNHQTKKKKKHQSK